MSHNFDTENNDALYMSGNVIFPNCTGKMLIRSMLIGVTKVCLLDNHDVVRSVLRYLDNRNDEPIRIKLHLIEHGSLPLLTERESKFLKGLIKKLKKLERSANSFELPEQVLFQRERMLDCIQSEIALKTFKKCSH